MGESDRSREQQPTSEELALGLTAFLGESSTTSSKVPFPLSSWPNDNGLTRIFALRFFQEWIWHNAQDSIELRSQFSFGLDAFGSTINESLAQVNQVVPNNRFFSWQGQAQRYSIHPLHSPELRALRRIEHDYPDTQYVFISERKAPLSTRSIRQILGR